MMLRLTITLIIFTVSATSTIGFAQTTFFDKKVTIKTKTRIVNDLTQIKNDSLARYYDSLFNPSTSVPAEMEIYRVTSVSHEPQLKTTKYYRVSNGNFVSLQVIHDNGLWLYTRTFDDAFTNKFRQLIDSTFWDYRKPTTDLKRTVFDGGSTKIEGLKNKTFKVIERSNPTEYDTLFRLPESFFRQY